MDVDRRLSKLNKSVVFAVVILLGGCDDINCIVDTYPQFSRDSLAVATLNQEYEDTLQVDIHSSIDDDDYDYRVTLEGRLPPGLSLQTSSSNRKVFFTGTPTQLGNFTFTLHLFAEPGNPGLGFNFGDQAPDLCDGETSQEFAISVVQGF